LTFSSLFHMKVTKPLIKEMLHSDKSHVNFFSWYHSFSSYIQLLYIREREIHQSRCVHIILFTLNDRYCYLWNPSHKKFCLLFYINNAVMFYSKSEKMHSLKSICPYMSDVCLSVRYISRWVSIDSLCMHNQTGDSQTSPLLFSWDLLLYFLSVCSVYSLSFVF
jgi:hypothetical protein